MAARRVVEAGRGGGGGGKDGESGGISVVSRLSFYPILLLHFYILFSYFSSPFISSM